MTKEELLDLIDSWENFELIVIKISEEPQYLKQLFEIILFSNNPKRWRAAWIADKVNDKHPELIVPFIQKIITSLGPKIDSSSKRHLLKLISLHTIPEEHYTALLDYCLDCMVSNKEPVAIRVHAMQILYNISEAVPEFKPELLAIIQHEAEIHSSPGFKARGKKLSQQLHRQIRQSGLRFL